MSQTPDRRGPDRQVRYGRILGLVFCVVGFLAIGFGWNGMAKVACADCQLPYLLSGGATGVGLILVGSALLVMAQIRDERTKLADQLREVGTAVSKAVSSPSAASGPGGAVVAGRSTYHRPECRLVQGKGEVDLVSVEVARLQGLSPCRVCNPPAPAAGKETAETSAAPASDSATGDDQTGSSRGSRKSAAAKASGRS